MDAKTLLKMFGVSHGVMRMNLDSLDHEASLVQPRPAGNCINWVVAHILAVRDQMFGVLGLEPVLGESGIRYRRGSPPVREASDAIPFPDLLAALTRSQERLEGALAGYTPEQLAAPFDGARLPGRPSTVAEVLIFFHVHESYHAGQLGVLRRVAGREGAIR
jgi:uncharacterized damage-inducible protein DinB